MSSCASRASSASPDRPAGRPVRAGRAPPSRGGFSPSRGGFRSGASTPSDHEEPTERILIANVLALGPGNLPCRAAGALDQGVRDGHVEPSTEHALQPPRRARGRASPACGPPRLGAPPGARPMPPSRTRMRATLGERGPSWNGRRSNEGPPHWSFPEASGEVSRARGAGCQLGRLSKSRTPRWRSESGRLAICRRNQARLVRPPGATPTHPDRLRCLVWRPRQSRPD
jgi:hypothetical protein